MMGKRKRGAPKGYEKVTIPQSTPQKDRKPREINASEREIIVQLLATTVEKAVREALMKINWEKEKETELKETLENTLESIDCHNLVNTFKSRLSRVAKDEYGVKIDKKSPVTIKEFFKIAGKIKKKRPQSKRPPLFLQRKDPNPHF